MSDKGGARFQNQIARMKSLRDSNRNVNVLLHYIVEGSFRRYRHQITHAGMNEDALQTALQKVKDEDGFAIWEVEGITTMCQHFVRLYNFLAKVRAVAIVEEEVRN